MGRPFDDLLAAMTPEARARVQAEADRLDAVLSGVGQDVGNLLDPDREGREAMAIVWHPARRSGDPTIGYSRINADIPAARVWHGEPVDEVAADYDLTVGQVELSVWWVTVHDRSRLAWKVAARRAWRDWAHSWQQCVWHSKPNPKFGHPGPPPSRLP